MKFMQCLSEDRKDTQYIRGKAVIITNLLDTKYDFCGFNDDLRDTIT